MCVCACVSDRKSDRPCLQNIQLDAHQPDAGLCETEGEHISSIQPSVINSLSTSTLRFFRYIWLLIYVIFACVMQPYYWPRLCNFSRTKSHWFCNFCVFCGCLFCCGRLSDLVRLSKQILSFEVKQTRTDGLSVSTKCVTNLTKFADAHCSVFVYVTWSGSSAPTMFRELCMILESAVNS